MTDSELQRFYQDLGNLLRRYDLRGFVGMWFHGDKHKGVVQLYQPADYLMRGITTTMAKILIELNNKATAFEPTETRGMSYENGEEN